MQSAYDRVLKRLDEKKKKKKHRVREVEITGGERVRHGSLKHVKDLERRITDLQSWKQKQKRGTENRALYTRLINRLKAELASAKASNERTKRELTEGGAVGHLAHVYDNPDMTFAELKDIVAAASEGKLERVSEKIDGMNCVFTWNERVHELRVARNNGDIKNGGMDATALAKKFFGRGNVEEAFNSAFEVLHAAMGAIPSLKRVKIFGAEGSRWYSVEVVYAQNPNVINYDSNNIVFHSWPIFDVTDDGRIVRAEDNAGVDTLSLYIERMQRAIGARKWRIRGPALVTMKKLSDGSVANETLSAIDRTMVEKRLGDSNTIGDYILASFRDDAKTELNVNDDLVEMIARRCAGSQGAPTLTIIKKYAGKENVAAVSEFVNNAGKRYKSYIAPIDKAISHLAVEVLRGIHSTLLDDSNAEVQRLRSQVTAAIEKIRLSGNVDAIAMIAHELERLGNVENISAAMEGVVFFYKGQAYKFTGAFQSVNQILGLLKYGRGTIKPSDII